MAIHISLNIPSETHVELLITGLDYINYPYKQIIIKDSNGTTLGSPDYFNATAQYEYYTTKDIFEPGTTYSIYVLISYWNTDFNDWGLQGTSNTINFVTDGGGGGGGDVPTYTAINSNNNIIVDIVNPGSNYQFWTYLFDSPTSASSIDSHHIYGDSDSYTGLSDGIYYIEVDYKDDITTEWTTLKNNITGQNRTEVPIGSGLPTYTYSKNDNSITLNAQNKGAYLLNFIVRLDSDPYDQSHTLYRTNNTSYTADNLQWNTDYRVNVGYSTVEDPNHITWISNPGPLVYIGAQPSSDDGYVYIYNGNYQWKKAIPYIYDGNYQWKKAIPYIYNGNYQWKKCIK